MQCWIARDGTVAIGDAVFGGIDVSALATNVDMVLWNSDVGELLHNDRVRAREKFTDISPYLPILNDWIRAASNLRPKGTANPPLTLAQGQTIKSALVDVLFASKRQAPITVDGQTYDGSDSETSAMSRAVSAASAANIDAMNAAFAALAAALVAKIAALATSVKSVGDQFATSHNTQIGIGTVSPFTPNTSLADTLRVNLNIIAAEGAEFTNWVPGAALTYGAITAPTDVSPAVTISGPAMIWPNIAGAMQSLSFAQMSALLNSFADRRASLRGQQSMHKTAIAALTTQAAVADYDITAGW